MQSRSTPPQVKTGFAASQRSWASSLSPSGWDQSTCFETTQLGKTELLGSYPVTDEHGSIYYQLLTFKHLHPDSLCPVVLNFDPHHDFYQDTDLSTMAVMSGCWGRPVTELGLAQVYTALPSLIPGNQGGFGQQDWCAPKIVDNPTFVPQIDFQSQLAGEGCTHELPCLHELQIHIPQHLTSPGAEEQTLASSSGTPTGVPLGSLTYRLQDYPGPIWLSIDYDFFSLRGYYHHNLREVDKQLRAFAAYLRDNGIQPTEILGYRSLDYLSLYSGEKGADRWIARVDRYIERLRAEILP
jgi:hypothetical protein